MSEQLPISAFTTISAGGILAQLTNQVKIQSDEKTFEALALWDTGATGTCISFDVVKKHGLIPTGMSNIKTPSGTGQVSTYLVNIILPNNVRIMNVRVCDSEIGNQGIGILIGMDIITTGDFAVSNYHGKTTFTFRYPSQKETDYVKELKLQKLVGTHGKGKRKHK